MWYPDYQNKKLNLHMFNSFKFSFMHQISHYADNQLRKKLNLCMLVQANKQESNKNTKYVLAN